MADPNPNQNSGSLTSMSQLISALHDLRNELVKTSLMLKNQQLHLNSVQRIAAAHAKSLAKGVSLPSASRPSSPEYQGHQSRINAEKTPVSLSNRHRVGLAGPGHASAAVDFAQCLARRS